MFPLIEYCRAGNLRAVSEWIAEKKPLDLPEGKKTRRSSPLQIAIEKGFLTLAEMLLDGGSDPCANGGNALWDAVNNHRSDIAELLLDRGVPLEAVSFSSVCYSADPALIKLFLDRGANPTEGHPFYHGFRHCLQPMLGAYKAHLEKVPALQIQADMALCQYAKEGNLRAVSLLMWAGARPDQIIPEEDCAEEFAGSCALLEAYRAGHIPILKRMKVENFPDKLPDLFNAFSLDDSTAAREYLLKLHPSLSDLPDGGTQVFDHAFWRLGWASDPKPIFGTRSSTKIDQCIDRMEFLARHGAKWRPEINSLKNTRRHIRHLEPDKILRLFEILHQHKATEVEIMENLVGTPTMRAHLGDCARKIAHLLHPPPAKKVKVAAIAPAEDSGPRSAPATVPQLTARAEAFLIDLIRKSPGVSFWDHRILTYSDNQKDRRVLGMSKEDERSRLDIFQSAAEKINRKFGSFEVEISGTSYRGSVKTITVLPKAVYEWSDVFEEVFRDHPDLNPRKLSEPALKILRILRKHHSSEAWLDEAALAEKAGLQTGSGAVKAHLEELRKKVGPIFHFESRERSEGSPQAIEFRVWWNARLKAFSSFSDIPAPMSLNSIFPGSLGRLSKRDVDDWRTGIFDYILGSKPRGTEPLYLLWIDTQKEMRRLFPNCNTAITSHGRGIAELVSELRLPEVLKVEYDFRDSLHWFARIVPEVNWAESLRIVEELCSQPSLAERYGLSEDAGRLLEWIEGLLEEEFLGDWTPVVEDAMERKIGIKCPWEQENIPAYLQFLLDEINRKTIYDLSVQPWKSYSRWQTRIRVQEKQLEEAKLVQNIQLLGLQRGKALSEADVKDFLSKLLDN